MVYIGVCSLLGSISVYSTFDLARILGLLIYLISDVCHHLLLMKVLAELCRL
jgi:hypothetical protein